MTELGLTDPTSELLRIWQKWLAYSGCVDRSWHPDPTIWGSLTVRQRNSLLDAEMLSCILVPALGVEKLSLRRPRELNPEVRRVLVHPKHQDSSSDVSAIGLLVQRVANFLDYYQRRDADGKLVLDGEGNPELVFTADSYVGAADGREDRSGFPPVVEAYTFSITVCLLVKLLFQQWEEGSQNGLAEMDRQLNRHVADQGSKVVDLDEVRKLADARLLAAMRGLQQCFIAVDTDLSETGRSWVESDALDRLRSRLRKDFELSGTGTPFELGFAWGRVHHPGDPGAWYADASVSLYYTLSALEGIGDLTSPSAHAVLTPEQAVVASTLSTYYDWCITYWRAIAQGVGRTGNTFAVEDVPWTVSSGASSLYYTLYLARLVAEGTATDQEELLDRLVRVTEELGHRARLTRDKTAPDIRHEDRVLSLARRMARAGSHEDLSRLLQGEEGEFSGALKQEQVVEISDFDDPAMLIHAEGLQILLPYDEDHLAEGLDPWTGIYTVRDFTPQYMKLAARVHQRVPDKRSRTRMRIAIDGAWSQLTISRDGDTASGYAWGDVERLIGRIIPLPEDAPVHYVRSWRYTQRVVEALMAVDESERTRRPAVPEVEAVLNGVLEEVRWQITGITDAGSANRFRQKLELLEGRVSALSGGSATRAAALASALDLAQAVADHRTEP